MNAAVGRIEAVDIVGCRCGGWLVGIEAACVRASRRRADDTAAVPLAGALGLAGGAADGSHVLTVKGEAADREFLIGAAAELYSVAADNIHPLPPLLAARCVVRGLRALALAAGETMLLIDPAVAFCTTEPQPSLDSAAARA